ncbi:MAG TPA: hypothetical protein VK150_08370, partial [Geothrix sp.]|nr:hypothetical protein [Geothrix sp.]
AGGEARVRAIRGLKLEAICHTPLVEQSDRPEGPYVTAYGEITLWRDVMNGREYREERQRRMFFEDWTPFPSVYFTTTESYRSVRGKWGAGDLRSWEEGQEALALSPERLLITACDAPDLRADGQETFQGMAQDRLRFTWRQRKVTLLLNPHTHLPTRLEVVRTHPESLFLHLWGDVATQTTFGNWQLVQGVALPLLQVSSTLGWPGRSLTILRATLDPSDAPWPTLEENLRPAAAQVVRSGPSAIAFRPNGQTLAQGVVFHAGPWNTTLVSQGDGVVVLEAPLPSEYSEGVIQEAARAFPDQPLKAVVSTSDAWPHLSGVRAYAARRLPIYGLDLNQSLLNRMLDAPHRLAPDAWERTKAADPRLKAQLISVSAKTVIGTGPNRLELYPIRGQSGERMLMAYFPEHRLLYGSDLVQRNPRGGFLMPIYLVDLARAVAREGLQVDTVFAMHLGPTPWAQVLEAIAQAQK